ncbi:hypothetical protein ACHQM5_015381 [Ranunculus cassubicifolius]
MFSLAAMPSTSSVFSAYASISTFMMLIQSIVNQFLPYQLQAYLLSLFRGLLNRHSPSDLTISIEQFEGLTSNEVYESSEIYLRTKIDPLVERLRVSKVPRENVILVTIEKGQEITDIFEGIQIKWKLITSENSGSDNQYSGQQQQQQQQERRAFELSFPKKYKEQVLSSYLPYVMEKAKALEEEKKVVKLYSLHNGYTEDRGPWGSINLDHPSTFDTLALDSDLKTELINDLDRFVRRRGYYKRVGKVWKRGYLLYGPPGTGKSSLIAAMANYLKFDIYDLELTSISSDSQLRSLLVSTSNRSILVIEDIDCSAQIEDREFQDDFFTRRNQFSLSGLLNFVDGLWSSCGDERIIIFTTNHKDQLDPALLRPGRMDMHIHMSYCTFCGFKLLASNYLGIQDHHPLFGKIEELLESAKVTPAEIAEELMKNEDSQVALECLVQLLLRKTTQEHTAMNEEKEVGCNGDITQETTKEDAENCIETIKRRPTMGGRGKWQRGRPTTRGRRGKWTRGKAIMSGGLSSFNMYD